MRYVDDTFLLFKSKDDIEPFKNYLNNKHRKIIFTSEIEIDGKLNFLDVSVSRHSSSFSTNTFIKPTDKGLSLKFDSAVSIKYKTNLISCLIDRAHKISSSLANFHKHLSYLKNYFCANNFPLKFVENVFSITCKKIESVPEPVQTAPKNTIYLKCLFMSHSQNRKLAFNLDQLLSEFYPQLDVKLIFNNRNTVGNLFR